MDHFFNEAAKATLAGITDGTGGPFGATLVRNGENVVAVGNTILRDLDLSGHAELVAVREGCKKLNTLDLSDCEMYATCEPCPMCVGVMLWAGIKTVYYSSTRDDAADHGFSDQHLRDYLDGTDTSPMTLTAVGPRPDCDQIWREFEAATAE